ncbi:hypothetical protein AALP_AAs44826U000100 [Arabis alpina]|uniref:Retrotransposon gag domain-containing protein n=1 Tax=Arabis alpina TaxID=50452 RepID=A0A087G1S8_ARAAL|nr:hypothetical protein AALP_AAs44826U000100 [Arabis alpina]
MLPNAEGQLVDREGNKYNDQGKKLDAAGNVVVEAAERTLGDYNRLEEYYANKAAIQPPGFARKDFELKPAFFSLLAQHQFHGHPSEHSMDYLERFEDLASSIKANGVSLDYVFCKVFPYSLAGDAAYWLKQLEPGHQMTLDSASNRDFKTRSRADCLMLIKNVASRNNTKKIDQERRQEGGITGRVEIAEVKAKIDSVHNLLVGRKAVHFAPEVNTFFQDKDMEQDINYINQNGYPNQRFGNQSENLGYNGYNQKSSFSGNPSSPSYVERSLYHKGDYQKQYGSNNNQRSYGSSSYQPVPAKSSESDTKAMLDQILEGQQKMTVNFDGKMDILYTNLNGKNEAMNIRMKKPDTQVAQTAENVRRQEGFLPAKTDTNPKQHDVAAITTRSRKVIKPLQRNELKIEKMEELEDVEEEELFVPDFVSIDTPNECRSTYPKSST